MSHFWKEYTIFFPVILMRCVFCLDMIATRVSRIISMDPYII